MNPITAIVGVLLCSYGVWVLTLRLQGKDEKFRKLGPMKEFWGASLGSAIHYFGYVVLPLALGISLVVMGLKGIDLLAFLPR